LSTQELQRDLAEMADADRLGKFLIFLDSAEGDQAPMNDQLSSSEDNGDDERVKTTVDGEAHR